MDPSWEAPSRQPPDQVPVLATDGFSGPLDWLLELARSQKINLAQLSIAALIDNFATALEAALAPAMPLGLWGDWLVMAADLTWLRSRLLLPIDAPGARDAKRDAEALRSLLLRRAQVAAAADWLARQPQLGQAVFGRGMLQFGGAERGGVSARATPGRAGQGDVTALLRACLVALRLPEPGTDWQPIPRRLWGIADARGRFQQRLGAVPDGSPLAAFLPDIASDAPARDLHCRAAVASTLVAGLELARSGTLALLQPTEWESIAVNTRELVSDSELAAD